MKESKGVYVSKRTMKQDFQRACGHENKLRVKHLIANCEVKRYAKATHEMGCQVDAKKDLGCTCRIAGTRHLNERYFNAAEQIYAYHGLRSYTNTGVGSVKALQRKRVRKIYLPETVDRGAGSTDLSAFFFRKTKCTCGSNYDPKKTSSKCVGGAPEIYYPVVNVKLSPIVKCNCATTGSEMPRSSEEKSIEISTQGTHTEDKKYVATTTQVEMITTVVDAPVDPISVPNAAKEVKEMPKELSKMRQRNKTLAAKAKAREEEKFSSDSLVQHIHDLECPSKLSRPSDDPVMENKIEREYRQIFATKSKSNQDQPAQDNRSTSLLRRRFEALRRGRKKEEPRNTVDLASSSPTSLASHKDVSIASDPPSLEARSYSRPSAPYRPAPTYDRTSYRRSVTGKKDRDSVNSIEDENELNQGVSGMFRLWGKKFNLDDQKKVVKTDDNSKIEESMDEITGYAELPPTESKEVEKKSGGRKFSFFKKKSKDKTKPSYKSKKGVTTNRLEVKNGLVLKIAGTSNGNDSGSADTKKQSEIISTEKYDEILRKAWLKKFLTNTIDSRDSVKIRWNNTTYTTSSSTVFELMDNVYKHTGIVIRSKSDITTHKPKKSNNKRVNFIHQNIEAWMMPKTIPDRPMLIPIKIKSTPDNGDTKNIEVSLPDQKWSIDTAKTFSHKIELVLHSNNVVQLSKNVSSDFLRIDIPKGFFSGSTTGDEQEHQCRTSEEEVYKIVEYETLKSNSDVKKKTNFDTGDHASHEITVTVKVKDSQNIESKVLETVIKRPSMQRDVVTQGSDVSFPKRCDVIGVGIITQREVREMKPILNVQVDLSEDESDPTTYSPKKNCEFAQSYLQDYYRDLMPQGIDLFSWCINDSNFKCVSEKTSAISLNHGDGSKSCPNIYEKLNTVTTEAATEAVTEASSDLTSSSHCGTNFEDEIINKSKIFFGRFCKEKRPKEQCAAVEKDKCDEKCKNTPKPDEHKRVNPKDSVEVFRKRKIYAVSQKKSKWESGSNSQDCSLPRLDDGPPDKPCPIKPCCKPCPKKLKSNSKHVIVTQPSPSPPPPCPNSSCPNKPSPTSKPVCQASLPPCPPKETPRSPSVPSCPAGIPPCPSCEPPCPADIPPCLPSKPSGQASTPPCPSCKSSCSAGTPPCPSSKPSCPADTPPCPARKPPLNPLPCNMPPPALKTPSSHGSKDKTNDGQAFKKSASSDTCKTNKSITINSNAVEITEAACSLKCIKPKIPALPCPSPPSPCEIVTPVSPSENDTPCHSNNPSKQNLVVRRCPTPPPPNVDPKMRSISPVTSLLKCERDKCCPKVEIKKRVCSISSCKKNQKNKPEASPKSSDNEKTFSIDCKHCMAPPCTDESNSSMSSKNGGSPQTPPKIPDVDTSKSQCQCPPSSPPAGLNQNALRPPQSHPLVPPRVLLSNQSYAPASYPRANQPKIGPRPKISLPINSSFANRPPSPPSCFPNGSFPKPSSSPPSFPPNRQFAANQLASHPSLPPSNPSTNRNACHPSCLTNCSFSNQSSSPPSLQPNRQIAANQLTSPPSLPPHPSTSRPTSPSCLRNCSFPQQSRSPPSLPPHPPSTNQSTSPPSCLTNRSFPKQSTPPSSQPDLPREKQPVCPINERSISYIGIIRKSIISLSPSPGNQPGTAKIEGCLSTSPPSTPPRIPCKKCCSAGVESSSQTNTPSGGPPLNQSSTPHLSIPKSCSQSAVTGANSLTPACVSTSSKSRQFCPVCSQIPPLECPRSNKNIKSKFTGLFLRKLPSKKKTNARSDCDDDKHFNIRLNDCSNDQHNGIREMKLQDEDGLTLCERTEYKKTKRSNHRPSVLGDMYDGSSVCHRVSTHTSEQKVNSNSKQCILPDESNQSLDNLMEIEFKMRMTQGDKITEINIGNIGDSEKNKVTKLKANTSRDIYVVNKASEPVTGNNSLGNDIDIRIIIKNFKTKNKKVTRAKMKKESVIDEFTRKISEKFHTVSTGYSDIVHSDIEQTGQPSNAFSVHRATWDLTCESDDKTKAGKTSGELSDYTDKETANINTNTSLSATTLTESVIKDDEIPEKPVVQEKSCISVNASVIKSDIIKQEGGEQNVTDDTDQSTGVDICIVSSSDTTRREKTPKEEKKKMLKMVIEKAGRIKHKNKDKVSKITRMLKTILTSDSSDHMDMAVTNDLAKDITYASLPPNVLRDTDSMNNFFKINSMMSDNEERYDRLNTSKDDASYDDEPPATKTCGGTSCLCSQVATKLDIPSGGGCCCRSKKPQKVDMETNCDIRSDEDMFLLNYGKSSFMDQETQRSRLFCSKANSVNVTFFKSVLSNELNIYNVSEFENLPSNNFENSSQEETKMIKQTSSPEAIGNVLNLSDEDKIIIANMEPTKYKIETVYTEVTHRKEPKRKDRLNDVVPADILQSYETKKAVLEMYTERTLSKGGEHLVAKLPKFSLENESDIIKYEKICTRSLIFSLKR